MHRANGEIRLPHLFRQPVNLALRIAEYDGLCYRQSIVEIAESVELPFLPFDGDEELFYSLQSQLIAELTNRELDYKLFVTYSRIYGRIV